MGKSLTVGRKHEATVHVWPFGEDPPEGTEVQVHSDGKRSAVKKEKGKIVRDRNDSAHAIPEGGGLIVHPNGDLETIGPKPRLVRDVDDDGNVTEHVEYGNNPKGVRRALEVGGYDVEAYDRAVEGMTDDDEDDGADEDDGGEQ